MVLSNKKLKAKLRGELTNSIVDAPSSSSNSLKLLLDSASHKPILSKREKRRKLQPLQPLHKNEQTNKENDTEGSDKKKNNKKRKRKVENQNNDNDDVANVVVSNDAVTNQSKKKKKEKKKIENQNDDVAKEVSCDAITKQSKKKKPKKKKVENQNDDVANEVSSDIITKKSKKKKQQQKKKKQKQKKKKAKTAEENGSTREGEVLESTLPELTKTNTTTTTTTTTSQENVEVPTKVYVGGIPYYSTEDDIRSYFEGCGTITEIDCMYFPETGKFRGIAFIGFKTEAAAKRALAFDGADMGGLFLKIQPFKADKAARPARFDPEIMEGYNRIYVGNLSWEITEEELKKFFSNCNIASIQFGMDKETGEFRGYAHVDFSDSQSLKTALKLDQSVLFGRPVRISCAVPLKKKPGTSKKLGAIEKSGAGEKAGEKPSPPVDSKMKGRTCYECGKKGHSFSACPNKGIVTSTTI